ncbi:MULTISPECIES: DUF3144 domain-containing protein [unclassified Oleiphilus]|uniref:DUF3144 domain-containing protein n=1 Tax=unclassified Oleiphilus TaxID=2631174 RepID=UPI0007C401AE|nr:MULTISPECIES: DUF3144 domain-containing protein [unclassified Oleiphilus]KZY29759.1 hypothetical protein A3729_11780 [Oleiphilus sp. HI0043]KZZ64397.1 hypothetical protein A3763_19730 [Oleiphilus sp. HI0128]KZZ67583.1 hypothetical protein A3763_15825 [Oleiphilus sp. HI0128]
MIQSENDKLTCKLVGDFLSVAHSMNEDQGHDIQDVSAAIQSAAACLNALEADNHCDCLGGHKEDAADWYTTRYRMMFERHADRIIEHQCP